MGHPKTALSPASLLSVHGSSSQGRDRGEEEVGGGRQVSNPHPQPLLHQVWYAEKAAGMDGPSPAPCPLPPGSG